MSEPNVGLHSIDNAPTEVPGGTDGKALKEAANLAHEAEKFRREIGWLGRLLGARGEKSGNIAGILVVVGLLLLACVYFFPNSAATAPGAFTSKDFASGLISLITLALGYLFGKNSKSK